MMYSGSAITPRRETQGVYIRECHVFDKEIAIERPLGATENLYWRFDAHAPINFGVVAELQGQIVMEQLREALIALQRRHPLLRVKIECDGKGRPWFRSGVGEIELRIVNGEHVNGVCAGGVPLDAWKILEQEVNIPLNSLHGPLMRCVLVRHAPARHSLVMCFHHSVSDGKSAVYLLRDLLQSLKRQQQGQSAALESLAPVGYYGDRTPQLGPWAARESIRTAWDTLKAVTRFLEGVGFPTGLQRYKDASSTPRTPGVLIEPRIVEPEIMQALAQRAKAERTTLQCVLNAALSLTVAADSPTGLLQRTACSQVLDMRDRLDPPVGEDCGLFASGATSLHALTADTPFWPLTRKIHEQLQHSIVTPLPFFHPAMHRHFIRLGRGLGVNNFRAFSEFVGRLHPEGLAVSNLGRVEIKVEGSPLEVTGFGFGTNTTVLNYLSTSAATLNGQMVWAFNGCSSLSRERLAHIADQTVLRMKQALKE